MLQFKMAEYRQIRDETKNCFCGICFIGILGQELAPSRPGSFPGLFKHRRESSSSSFGGRWSREPWVIGRSLSLFCCGDGQAQCQHLALNFGTCVL